MATTYKKALKTIRVFLHGMDEPIIVSDTATSPDASNALAEFENGYKMHLKVLGDDDTKLEYVVPYHAVTAIVVRTELSEDITKADPYCED